MNKVNVPKNKELLKMFAWICQDLELREFLPKVKEGTYFDIWCNVEKDHLMNILVMLQKRYQHACKTISEVSELIYKGTNNVPRLDITKKMKPKRVCLNMNAMRRL